MFYCERACWNFGKVIVILSVILTVSCSAERSFSVLPKQKQTRSTMGLDHLSHLALLYIERSYDNGVDIEKVIDEFQSKKGCSKFFFHPIFRPKNVGYLS